MKTNLNIFLTAKERRERKNAFHRPLRSFAVPVFLWFVFAGCANSSAASWKKAYKAGDYTNAFQALEKMTTEFPSIGNYNRACVLYRQKDFQGSEKLFGEVAAQTEDDELKQKAFYNRGTALLASTTAATTNDILSAISQAIDLFEQALELDPTDLDAKQNLERGINMMTAGHVKEASRLIDEADQLLTKDQAKSAKENYEKAQKILKPVLDDFAPDNQTAKELTLRADGQLQMLERAVKEAKTDMENAKQAVKQYEYKKAADLMLADKPTRRWAFDLDKKLAQEFKQMVQNNQNVINIIYPPTQPTTPLKP